MYNKLTALADALLERESLDENEIRELIGVSANGDDSRASLAGAPAGAATFSKRSAAGR